MATVKTVKLDRWHHPVQFLGAVDDTTKHSGDLIKGKQAVCAV